MLSQKLQEQLSKCDREPIHLASRIQNIGCLLVVDCDSHELVQVSSNTSSYGFPPGDECLGRSFESFFADASQARGFLDSVRKKTTRASRTSGLSSTLEIDRALYDREKENWWEEGFSYEELESFLDKCKSVPYTELRTSSRILDLGGKNGHDAKVHCMGFELDHGERSVIVVEVESTDPLVVDSFEACKIVESMTTVASELGNLASLKELCERSAKIVQESTGFDRVMIYRFLDDGHGLVTAETSASTLDLEKFGTFLGMKFPGTDIPEQARALYVRNKVRSIANVDADPVPLIPPLLDGRPLDLSDSRLRNVSPIHVKYLKNMGVTASASASLVVEGKLWGLIACHGYRGEYVLNAFRRMRLLTVAALLQNSVEAHLNRERQRILKEVHEATLVLETPGFNPEECMATLSKDLARIFDADAILLATYKPEIGNPTDSKMQKKMAEEAVGGGEDMLTNQFPSEDIFLKLSKLETHGAKVNAEYVHEAATELFRRQITFNDVPCTASIKDDLPDIYAKYKTEIDDMMHIKPCGLVVAKCMAYDLVLVRKELEQNIRWAGKDAFEIATHQVEKALMPRNSFAAYNQAVIDRAQAWQPIEIDGIKLARMRLLAAAERVHVTNARVSLKISKMANMFLAHMSHELRTPFNGIVGMLSVLLDDDKLPEHVRNMLQTVNRSAESMLDILDDILTVTKLEEGKMQMRLAPFSMANMLKDVRSLFQVRAQKLGVNLAVKISTGDFEEGQFYVGDAGRIRQILLNLVGNALRFVPSGGGEVLVGCSVFSTINRALDFVKETSHSRAHGSHSLETIRKILAENIHESAFQAHQNPTQASHVDSSSDVSQGSRISYDAFAVLTVEDNGCGVEKEATELLFRKFSQVDTSSKKLYQGTGLGLSICSQLCQLMGGGIWCFATTAESTAKQEGRPTKRARTEDAPISLFGDVDATSGDTGSIFQFLLPLSTSKESDDLPLESSEMETSTFKSLVYDDNSTGKDSGSENRADVGGQALHVHSSHIYSSVNDIRLVSGLSTAEETILNQAMQSTKKIVLAADDNQINRAVLTATFTRRIPEVFLAVMEGGVSCTKVLPFLENRVQAVLLDHHMPDMSGIETGQILRKKLPPEVPIFIVTADCSLTNEQVVAMGLSGIIFKPVSVAKIRACLNLDPPPAQDSASSS